MKDYKTLHLNLTKKWFDMILSGKKTEEYRETSNYWCKRLIQNYVDNAPFATNHVGGKSYVMLAKEYDTVTFSNGYSRDRPQFVIQYKGLIFGNGKEEWGASGEPAQYFVLGLGKVISTNNC